MFSLIFPLIPGFLCLHLTYAVIILNSAKRNKFNYSHLFIDQSVNISILTTLLKTQKLRPDVTMEEVVEVFCEYQDFVNTRFQMKSAGKTTLKAHEARGRRSLQILLYGVIERQA